MTVLAIDQSSRVSGWAVFNDNKLIAFDSFTFDDTDIGQRLTKIRNKVKSLIDIYTPDHVIFEDIQLQNNIVNNVQTFKVLAEVYGIISQLLTELKIPHSTVLAGTWKSFAGIKGRTRQEQKKNAQKYVEEEYSIKVIQDIADAICIGEYGVKHNKSAWD